MGTTQDEHTLSQADDIDIDAVLKENQELKDRLADMKRRNAMLRDRPDLPADRTGDAKNYEAEIERHREAVDKLPRTEDGVPVVPNGDAVWINPSEAGGWQHDGHNFPREPIAITNWAHHRDHIWLDHALIPENIPSGDHWWGKFYSTREAAEGGA